MGSLRWPVTGCKVFQSIAADAAGRFPHALGARGEDGFGRTYRFAQAGAVTLVTGDVIQSPAQIANHQDTTPAAAAIGDKTITVTPGATGGAANLYAGGMAIISVTPGLGFAYPIKAHDTITASTAFVVFLEAGWEIQVALTGSSRVTLVSNTFKNVIQSPVTTLTNGVAGVAAFPIAASEAGWLGTGGVHGVLIAGTPAVGTPVGVPSGTAGAASVILGTDAAVPTMIIGRIKDTGEAGKVSPVDMILN